MSEAQRDTEPAEEQLDKPIPAPADPGGAHVKGYSADPTPDPTLPAGDPLPLAPGTPGTIKVPERDNHITPTGRDELHDSTSNDRLMGSDR